jgi:crooked neck
VKAAAPIQITAEQLLREAYERQDVAPARPKHAILDLEELQEYQGRQRKDFENKLRRNRLRMGEWLRYANWELEQKEFARYKIYSLLSETNYVEHGQSLSED